MEPRPAELDRDLTWVERRAPRRRAPALFLDRDGVLVEEVVHLHEVEKTRVIAGAAAVVRRANALGLHTVIVSNQSGIGRRLFGWDDFRRVQERILDELARAGARIDAVLACPHVDAVAPPYGHPDHPDRKPNPGMLLKAQALLDIDLGGSWIIGDRAGDLGAGRAAGLAGGLHVLTGFGPEQRAAALAEEAAGFTVLTGETVRDALDRLAILAE